MACLNRDHDAGHLTIFFIIFTLFSPCNAIQLHLRSQHLQVFVL